jgi:hypothetical protein
MLLRQAQDFLAQNSLQEVKEPLGFSSQPDLHFLPNNAQDLKR